MNIITRGQVIKVPKPVLVVNVELGRYAFKCEHKRLGIAVWGDSRDEARNAFVDQVAFELSLIGA